MTRLLSALLPALALAILVAIPADAGTLTVTPFPSYGTITNERLDSRFDQVEAVVNGGLGDANFSSSEPLTVSKLANPNAFVAHPVQISCSTKTSAWMHRLPAAGTLVRAFLRCRDCSSADYDVDIQVAGTTRIAFAAVTGSTIQDSGAVSYSVGSSDNVEIDVTQNTAGSCSALDVTMYFTLQHQQ